MEVKASKMATNASMVDARRSTPGLSVVLARCIMPCDGVLLGGVARCGDKGLPLRCMIPVDFVLLTFFHEIEATWSLDFRCIIPFACDRLSRRFVDDERPTTRSVAESLLKFVESVILL
jgi:hypothetical protein